VDAVTTRPAAPRNPSDPPRPKYRYGVVRDIDSLTPLVLASMARTPAPRLRELMSALVGHAHAFVREVNLTEDEFEQALEFVVGLGQATDAKKNEAVLAADILGISTLVMLLNNADVHGGTHAALLGPFWRLDAPECAPGESITRCDTDGEPLEIAGTVRDVHGAPIANAEVDVWHASPVGLYENQDPEQPDMNLRGRFRTDAQGRYRLRTIRPAGYPVPTDGPCGELLRAQDRHPYRPAHVHFMVSAPGYRVLVTQVFVDDDERLESDVVFGVTRDLAARLERVGDGWYLTHDFVLARGEQRFPRPPIK
jgi:catechol 1,2-dioxygenase